MRRRIACAAPPLLLAPARTVPPKHACCTLISLCPRAAHIAALSIGGQDDSAMFGVFDGHGTAH